MNSTYKHFRPTLHERYFNFHTGKALEHQAEAYDSLKEVEDWAEGGDWYRWNSKEITPEDYSYKRMCEFFGKTPDSFELEDYAYFFAMEALNRFELYNQWAVKARKAAFLYRLTLEKSSEDEYLEWRLEAHTARSVYKANPTPENRMNFIRKSLNIKEAE